MSKSQIITFRATAEEKKAWSEAAAAVGSSLTDVCRDACENLRKTVAKAKGGG